MAFPASLKLFMNVQRARTHTFFPSLPDLFLSTLLPLRFCQRDGADGTAHMQFALWPGRLMNPFGR